MSFTTINHVFCASCTVGFLAVSPGQGSLREQIVTCIDSLKKYLTNTLPHTVCFKQTYFVRAQSNEEVQQIQNIISTTISDNIGTYIPLSVVPQPPLGKATQIVAEYAFMSDVLQAEHKTVGNISYLKLTTSSGIYLSAAGLNKYLPNSNILEQSIGAFEQMRNILKAEDFTFGNIIRQWNYIERIIEFTENSQHYQIFNDVRSDFYASSDFPHGYPSATGIGMSYSGIVLEFLAFRPAADVQVVPLQSPVQANAHQYSSQVLSVNQYSNISCVGSTPKFERGKAICFKHGGGILFVSGTAAIKGELSASQYDAAMQTRMTLQNINNLISQDNLKRNGITNYLQTKPLMLRVYVKYAKDFETIEKIVGAYAGDTPVLYLQADICRPELLVEIEGVFQLNP